MDGLLWVSSHINRVAVRLGNRKDGVWLDEEPPMDIYGECLIRTATTHGIVYTTFTPLEGMSDMAFSFLPHGMPKAD